ncbi:MAG: hypothetical protein JO255_22145 [Alphaproteobacteria bacterium]|nr:hypothetical protein [Alphaproteobacteria bacterium]
MTMPLTEMRRAIGRTTIALAAGLLPWAALAAAPPAHPYNLRNIPLGISLTQFRKMAHPDGDARGAKAQVLCSGDPGGGDIEGLALSPVLLQADTTKCGYYVKTPVAGGEQYASAPMTFLGEAISPLFLFYRPEGATDYGLAQITFGLSNRRGSETIGLFYRAYGGPASLDVTSVPTTFGSEMSNIRYIWKNDLSSIQLDSLSFVLDQMSVVFAESRLWGDLSDRMATIERMARIASQEEKRQRDAAEAAAQAQKSGDAAQSDADGASPSNTASSDATSSDASSKTASTKASSTNAASGDAAKGGAAPAKSPLAGALPPGSPLAGFLAPGSPLASSPPGSSLPASSSPVGAPPAGGSPAARSPLAGALPPGSPLAGFLPAAPPSAAP